MNADRLFDELDRLRDFGRLGTASRLAAEAAADRGRGAADRYDLRQWLARAERERAARPGRAWFPVELQGALAPGLVPGALVCAQIHPGATGPGHDTEIADALRMGAEAAGARGEGLYWELTPRRILVHEASRSLLVAVAVAAWSYVRREAVPAGVAFTGAVGPGGRLTAPPDAVLALKRDALREEWGADARLLTGPSTVDGVETFATLADLLAALGGAPIAAAPARHLAQEAESAYVIGDWSRARRLAERALAAPEDLLDDEQRFALHVRLGQIANHLGDGAAAARAFADAERWLSAAGPLDRAELAASLAIHRIDADDLEGACALLRDAVAAFDRSSFGGQGRRQEGRLRGTFARALSAVGAHDAAIEAGERALDLAPSAEKCRNAGDLAFWHLRAGRPHEALRRLDEADALADRHATADPLNVARTRTVLRLFRARALLHLGRRDAAAALLADFGPLEPHAELPYLELRAWVGEVDDALAAFDARHAAALAGTGVVARYRARIELRRPAPDRARVAAWTRQPPDFDAAALLARLERRLPY